MPNATISIVYNGLHDLTKIKTSPAFDAMSNLQKCDCLRDVTFLVDKLYNETLAKGICK